MGSDTFIPLLPVVPGLPWCVANLDDLDLLVELSAVHSVICCVLIVLSCGAHSFRRCFLLFACFILVSLLLCVCIDQYRKASSRTAFL